MWASSRALLTFVLCLLSLHCACAFPAPRTAPKSARQDDLISGSDFLSVFIGAASRKAGSRPRDATVPRDPQQEDGNSDLDSMIEAFSSESSGFGTRTKPRGEGAPSPRSSKDPMSLIFDVENTRDKGGLDEVGEVSTTAEDITSTLPQDYKPSRKKETPKHFPRTFTSNQDILKSLPHSEDSTDFNSNVPETSTVPEFYKESTTLKPSSITIILENQETAADEEGTESVNTPANEFTTDQTNYFTEATTFNPDQETTTDNPLNDEFVEISRLSELTDIKKINQQTPRPTVITKSKRLHSNSAPGNEYYASATSADILREDAQRTSESPTFYEVHQDNISLLPRNKTHQVISVRVSSTVVLAPGHTTSRIQDTTKEENTEQDKEILKKYVDAFPENADYNGVQPPGNSISLVTEEQPAATAIQRSQFIVEESQPSSSEVATFPNKPSDLSQHQTIYVATSSHSREPLPDPQTHPVSYQTSISSATSGSRVQFYSEPPNYRKPSSMAESVQQTVVTSHQHQPVQESRFGQKVHTSVGGQGTQFGRRPSGEQYAPQHPGSFSVAVNRYQQQQQAPKKDNPDREQKSYHGNTHQEPVEQNYEQAEQNYGTPERVYGEREKNYEEPEMNYGVPERNYGMPEQNYEVDEAVSVMSNGRVHGVQTPPSVTPHNTDHGTTPVTAEQNDPNHKFGYVVEGRNFRKYRVEERTPDGFIVGEYGVVSHDDGSLRGVRYTADSTINPKLIYEALVKFLSL